ncbi:hypothetical protein NPIL_684281 [Nephila pilipes]|uniref:Uncharacterized protein n=1 Tax=Nephila pilipes TaxID=299642 RepID=A0A8X6NSW4_NEPPI|nr:hypothetical protein NPIL_684281 [Nephila pilipes]
MSGGEGRRGMRSTKDHTVSRLEQKRFHSKKDEMRFLSQELMDDGTNPSHWRGCYLDTYKSFLNSEPRSDDGIDCSTPPLLPTEL